MELDIEKLSVLARIKLGADEKKKLRNEFAAILDYISALKKVDIDSISDIEAGRTTELKNIMREDIESNKPGEFSDDLLNSAPSVENGYIKVKNILG